VLVGTWVRRSRVHRQGNHDLCLVGRCKELGPDATQQAAAEVTAGWRPRWRPSSPRMTRCHGRWPCAWSTCPAAGTRQLSRHCGRWGSWLTKGSRVVVLGRLQQRSWTAENGSARSTVEVVADELGPSLRWAPATTTRAGRPG
jgi:hypothetical protein